MAGTVTLAFVGAPDGLSGERRRQIPPNGQASEMNRSNAPKKTESCTRTNCPTPNRRNEAIHRIGADDRNPPCSLFWSERQFFALPSGEASGD